MNAPASMEQFHTERMTGIGGSDVAVIFGLSKWKTPYQLWLEKTGRERSNANSLQMRFGTYAEQFVADEYTRQTGRLVQRFNPLIKHPDAPLIGHVDRLVIPDGQKRAAHQREIRTDRLLEAKTASAYALGSAEWGDPGTDAVPAPYLLQCAAYMALTGCQYADLAALFGNQEFRIYHLTRDLELESMILDEASRWWRSHVIADTPPDPSTEAEARQRWSLHQPGKSVDLDEPTMADLRALVQVKADIKRCETMEQTLKDRLLPVFADAEIICYQGQQLATYKTNRPTLRTDWKSLATELLEDYDETERAMRMSAATTLTPGARVLRLAKGD